MQSITGFRSTRIALLVGLALHLVAAWNSVGYHQPDEHWQIMEFASHKMGFTPAQDLAWEFEAKIRPWLQPGLQVLIYKVSMALGVQSLKWLSFAARLFMALLGWSSVLVLLWAIRPQLRSAGAWSVAVWTSMLFWFHPWFHARTSSEGFSAAFLLLGIAALMRFRPWLAGVCLGAAFQARYLMVIQIFAVLGMVWWGAMGWRSSNENRAQKKSRWKLRFSAWGFLGVLTTLGLGALVDRWGYGTWVFPGWRYVVVNGLQGKSHQFGVFPWYDYVIAALVKMPPVLGAFSLTVLLSFWVGFWARAREGRWVPHWLTWMTAPFIGVHLWIAHKELRFLYPIASFLPLMLALWIERLAPHWKWWVAQGSLFWRDAWRKFALVLLWGINFPYLLFGVIAAERNPMRFQMEIADRFPQGLTLHSDSNADIYDDCILPIHWGMPPNYHFVRGLKDAAVARTVAGGSVGKPVWFFTERLIPEKGIREALGAHCERVYSVVPSWLTRLNFGGWAERVRAWSLWKCDR